MNASAEAFLERLARHEIRYKETAQPDGSHLVAIEMAGQNGALYNVVLVFSPDGMEAGVRIFQLGHVPTERQRPMLRTLNAINGEYAWLRFYLDSDSDVAAAMDGVLTPGTAAKVCWEMLIRAFSVLDAVQEKIDAVLK